MPVPSVTGLPSVVVHGGFEYFRAAEREWREPSGYEVPRNMANVLETLYAERTKTHADTQRLTWLAGQEGVCIGLVTMATSVRDRDTGEHLETDVAALMLCDRDGNRVGDEIRANTLRDAIDRAITESPPSELEPFADSAFDAISGDALT